MPSSQMLMWISFTLMLVVAMATHWNETPFLCMGSVMPCCPLPKGSMEMFPPCPPSLSCWRSARKQLPDRRGSRLEQGCLISLSYSSTLIVLVDQACSPDIAGWCLSDLYAAFIIPGWKPLLPVSNYIRLQVLILNIHY